MQVSMQGLALLLLSTHGMPILGGLLCNVALLHMRICALLLVLLLAMRPCSLLWLHVCAWHDVILLVCALLIAAISSQLPVCHASVIVACLLIGTRRCSAISCLQTWCAQLVKIACLPACVVWGAAPGQS